MRRIFAWLNGRRQQKPVTRNPKPSCRLEFEALEDRLVPATIGSTKFAILDFNGGTVSSAHMSQSGFTQPNGTSVGNFTATSFLALYSANQLGTDQDGDGDAGDAIDRFLARRRFDVNGDGTIDNVDAVAAITQITNKVRQDYAPYNIQVNQGNYTTAMTQLDNLNVVGNAVVMISGAADTLGPLMGQNAARGWGGLDIGNNADQVAFVFAPNMLTYSSAAQIINAVARTISHEMGHTFGLDHINNSGWTDDQQHHLMSVPVDINGNNNFFDPGEDQRDFTRDFVFLDRNFNTPSGEQNAHRILSREDVLGRSSNPWMAVLAEGRLTVSGGTGNDNLQVSRLSDSQWRVYINGVATNVDLNANGVSTLNPFDTPISQLTVAGWSGDDYIAIWNNMTIGADIYGDDGNDTIYGGSRDDVIRGGNGDDNLYGRDGNDRLYGNSGTDFLSGGSGNDRLDGGDDGFNDTLNGGSGSDTFFQNWGWIWFEETIQDKNSNDTEIHV